MSAFLVNLTVPNKHFFSVKLLLGLRDQVCNSQTTYKLKIKLLYNEEKAFSTKTESLNFKITLPLSKLHIVSNGLDFQMIFQSIYEVVNFLLLFNIRELSIGAKTRKF